MALILKIALVFLSVIGLSLAAKCPPHWTFYRGSCYRFFGPAKTWQDAEDHCRGFFTSNGQGHLASIHESSTNGFLVDMWKSSAQIAFDENRFLWIGLNDQDVEDQFAWSDGTAIDFQGWITGEPNNHLSNEECVEFWYDFSNGLFWGWNDRPCSLTRSYVCKMAKEC